MNRVQRRDFLIAAGALLAAPLAAEAQQAAKIARIGYLAADRAANPHLQEAFPDSVICRRVTARRPAEFLRGLLAV